MKPGKPISIWTMLTVLVLVSAVVLSGCAGGAATPTSEPAGQGPAPAATQAPGAVTTPATSGGSAPSGSGATRDYILIGRPNPQTGALAAFGEASPWAEDRALEAVNKDGGITVDGKKMPVKIKFVDTESNPTKASEVASQLILNDKVDLLLVEHTPDTVNPVAAVAERYQIPTISLDAPVDAWLTGGPYKWNYHAFWTVDSVADLYISMWEQGIAKDSSIKKTVGYLFPNDPDGMSWAPLFTKKLEAKGYKVVDPGRFPYGTKDYSAMINQFKSQGVDIVAGTLPAPDFATLWRQMHQQGYVPKMATVGKALLFPSDAAALGEKLAEGITNECWWSPFHPFKSSLTGETAQELADAWTKETNKQWNATLGYKYAGVEIAIDALKRAGTLDKAKLLEAIAATDLDTMVGHIKYNDKHYSETPLVGGQWHVGKTYPWEISIVNNSMSSNIPTTGEIAVPLPK